ncbi:hypothetical protein Aduo_009804 [Ancylostoma duodenale]
MPSVVLDIEIVGDRNRAMEILRNMWNYQRLQGCHLDDVDLASVPFAVGTVKYVCLRGNDLVRPWNVFKEKFPELIYLDCRRNIHLNFDTGNHPDITVLQNLERIHVDVHLLQNRASVIKEMFPCLEYINGKWYSAHTAEHRNHGADAVQ